MNDYYRRNLPHWQPEGADYFITFRLAGSLPKEAIAKIKSYENDFSNCSSGWQPELRIQVQRLIFKTYEELLDKPSGGPTWLQKDPIARTIQESIHYRDNDEYDLYAYTIMPNHVHLVLKHIIQDNDSRCKYPVTEILRGLKRYTARQCNKLLNRKGAFWQSESYDRVIRDARELENTMAYTLNNPVKAGLVEKWQDWQYSYCKSDFLPTFSHNIESSTETLLP